MVSKTIDKCSIHLFPAMREYRFFPYFIRLQLDLDVHACGQMHAVQKLCIGAVDVDDPLVGADLKLLAAVLVFVGRAKDGNDLLFGRQRDGAADLCARFLHSVHNALRREVYEFVIVCGEFDSDFLSCHFD